MGAPWGYVSMKICFFHSLGCASLVDKTLISFKWLGHLPGSMAQGTVVGGTTSGAVSSSKVASCATLGELALSIPPFGLNLCIIRKRYRDYLCEKH